MESLIKLLFQRSTIMGLLAILSGFGVALSPELQERVIELLLVLGGIAGVLFKAEPNVVVVGSDEIEVVEE